jgi:hypothetical protein
MKRIIIIAGIVFSGLFTSCDNIGEEYLDTPSKSTLDEAILFSSSDLAKGAVDGIKIPFGEQNSYRGRFLTYYGLNSDTEWFNNSRNVDAKSDLCTYDPSPTNTEMNTSNNVWAMSYSAIERANICVRGIRMYGNPVAGSDMGQLLGESLTLRAIYYADLLRAWGDIPYRFEPITNPTIYIPKTNRDVIYKQLIADLGEAENLVAWPNAIEWTKSVENVNKVFVKALRARLAMVASGYQQYPDGIRRSTDPDLSVANMYALALRECREIISSGSAKLDPSFENLWRNYNKEVLTAGGEPLWEIPFAEGRGRVLYTYAVKHTKIDQYQAMGDNRGGISGPLPTVWYDFDEADSRRSVTCVPYRWGTPKSVGTPAVKKAQQELGSLNTWYFGKFRFEWTGKVISTEQDDGINKIYMRYAEVLLIAAEAANEIEGPTAAAPYLKEIRSRAFPKDVVIQREKVDNYVDALTSKDAMFKALVKENKYEFTGELDRKMALIRWNLLKSSLDEAKVKMSNLAARTGEYADVPKTLYFKYESDNETLNIYGLNRGETTVQDPAVYEPFSWSTLTDEYINSLYKAGKNPDNRQFWPIWQVFIDASNGQLVNDYGY